MSGAPGYWKIAGRIFMSGDSKKALPAIKASEEEKTNAKFKNKKYHSVYAADNDE